MTMATRRQMATIRHQRIDDTARAMMDGGVTLTWRQRDDIGDACSDWLVRRLGLTATTTEDGVRYEPRALAPKGR